MIKTASLRELNKLPKESYKVLVTRYYPFYIKDIKKKIDEWVSDLAPSRELLIAYKDELKRTTKPRVAWEISKYENRFRREILNGTESMKELKRIGLLSKDQDVYLLCHEATEEYCHRRILRELIELGLDRGWI